MTSPLKKTLDLYQKYDKEYPYLWGWCTDEKAEAIVNILRDIPNPVCVEIGVFGGRSAVPVLYSLKEAGHLYAIDPWSNEEASRGYQPRDAEYWSNIPLNQFEQVFRRAIKDADVEDKVTVLKQTSDKAAIPDDLAIDYLHIDGQHTPQLIHDINKYASKVRVGGYCILDDVVNNDNYWNIEYIREYIRSLGFYLITAVDKAIIYKRVTVDPVDWKDFDREGIETTVKIVFEKKKVQAEHFKVFDGQEDLQKYYRVKSVRGQSARDLIKNLSAYSYDLSHMRLYEPSGKDVTFECTTTGWFDRFDAYWSKANPQKNYLIVHWDELNYYIRNPLGVNIQTIQKPKVWVVDNFYHDPDSVRSFALSKQYHEGGFGKGYIGRRTVERFHTKDLFHSFKEIMGMDLDKDSWEFNGMNGRFQVAWAGEPLVYHCDSQKWAAMIFLTPDAPYSCGTTLYAHKKTRARSYHDKGWDASWGQELGGDPHLDGTPFEPVDVIGNVYNRLVIFDASSIHSASQYFGTVMSNARLWHMFFFD